MVVVVGCVLGALASELLGAILPRGVIREFFVRSFSPSLGPMEVNLGVLSLTLGLSLKVTVASVLGILLAVYIFRWY